MILLYVILQHPAGCLNLHITLLATLITRTPDIACRISLLLYSLFFCSTDLAYFSHCASCFETDSVTSIKPAYCFTEICFVSFKMRTSSFTTTTFSRACAMYICFSLFALALYMHRHKAINSVFICSPKVYLKSRCILLLTTINRSNSKELSLKTG